VAGLSCACILGRDARATLALFAAGFDCGECRANDINLATKQLIQNERSGVSGLVPLPGYNIFFHKERDMGEKYRAELEAKIREFGGSNLRVFINADGVNPHYKQHLEDTFRDAGVRFVSQRAEANFVFDGDCEPNYLPGQIVAFFTEGNIAFAGGF
jgi:hypothetical protein